MRRRQRIHVSGGTYYVRMEVYGREQLVTKAADAAELSRHAGKAATLCDASIHAYRWGERRADLLIQIGRRPLGETIQRINGPFSQYAQAARGRHGPLFRRYRAALVASEVHLLQLVRYIHVLPVMEGAASTPDGYPWSSHHDYASARHTSWLTTELVRKLLVRRMGGRARDAYARWMAAPVTPHQVALFENSDGYLPTRTGAPLDPTPPSIARVRVARTPTRKDLLPLISQVCAIVGITSEQVLSRSRVKSAVLARALIARHAMRTGFGSLADVARCLDKHPTVLQRAIDSYSEKYPSMFSEGGVAGSPGKPPVSF
jgi:hypothetical protein